MMDLEWQVHHFYCHFHFSTLNNHLGTNKMQILSVEEGFSVLPLLGIGRGTNSESVW